MVYKFLSTRGTSLGFGLFLVCLVIAVIPVFSGISDFNNVPVEKQAYSEEGNIFLTGIYLSIFLMFIAAIAILFFSLFQVVSNPKASMKAIISFVVVLVLFFILYSLADAEGTGSLAQTIDKFSISDTISKIVGGGINLSFILLIGAFALAVLLEIWNFFKNQ